MASGKDIICEHITCGSLLRMYLRQLPAVMAMNHPKRSENIRPIDNT